MKQQISGSRDNKLDSAVSALKASKHDGLTLEQFNKSEIDLLTIEVEIEESIDELREVQSRLKGYAPQETQKKYDRKYAIEHSIRENRDRLNDLDKGYNELEDEIGRLGKIILRSATDEAKKALENADVAKICLLYTSPSPRDS